MPIVAAACDSFKRDVLLSADTFKLALYRAGANLSKATTAYSTRDEVIGPGYEPGGAVLAGMKVTLNEGVASLTWTDPIWPQATITARGALIYNASKSNRSVAVLEFGEDVTSTNGRYTVELPSAVVRLL